MKKQWKKKFRKDIVLDVKKSIFKDSRLNSTDKLVIVNLRWRQGNNYWAWPNQATIADALGLNLRTVRRVIGKLIKLNYIRKAWWDHGFGKGKELSYHLNEEVGGAINDLPIIENKVATNVLLNRTPMTYISIQKEDEAFKESLNPLNTVLQSKAPAGPFPAGKETCIVRKETEETEGTDMTIQSGQDDPTQPNTHPGPLAKGKGGSDRPQITEAEIKEIKREYARILNSQLGGSN